MASGTIWDQVLSRIEDQVGKHSFSTWFKPTSLLTDAGESLSIRVPNPLFVEWLPKHYSIVMAEAMRDVGRPDVKLVFIPQGSAEDTQTRAPAIVERSTENTDETAGEPPADEPQRAGSLIPRYTFDTFIVGPSNQFAHAACRAVAETPSRSYNPLFIHGGVGLGKTHLMHAMVITSCSIIRAWC
jgi:chromosomal replication initiator protein